MEKGLLTEIELENRLKEYWDLYWELWNDDVIDESDYESGFDYWSLEAQADKTLAKIREVVEGAGLTPTEIGDSLDLEVESKYPCSDGSISWTVSVDKLLQVQHQAILKAIDGGSND